MQIHIVWFGLPIDAKREHTQAFLSACPDIVQQGIRSDRLETCQEFNIKNGIKLLQLISKDLLISELYHV